MSKNIATLVPSESILEYINPATDKERIGIRATILSIDDERMKKIKRKISDARIALEKKNKSFSQEERDHNTRVMLCEAMTGWEWYIPELEPARVIPAITAKGTAEIIVAEQHIPAVMGEQPNWNGDEHPEFNKANVMAFLQLEWAYDQTLDKVGDTKSFFQH